MPFVDFLKTSVLLCGASASLLGALTVAGATTTSDQYVVPVSAVWWLLATVVGLVQSRRAEINPPIRRLLASARAQSGLPELQPALVLLNRLWPLLLATTAAGVLSFLLPQVAGIAAGFAIVPALALRNQEAAVSAIEERDGARFYIERTSPLKPIKLVRTLGLRTERGSVRA